MTDPTPPLTAVIFAAADRAHAQRAAKAAAASARRAEALARMTEAARAREASLARASAVERALGHLTPATTFDDDLTDATGAGDTIHEDLTSVPELGARNGGARAGDAASNRPSWPPGQHPYALAALRNACRTIALTGEGARNDTLTRTAFAIGTLCHPAAVAGYRTPIGLLLLDDDIAWQDLYAAALSTGLPAAEADSCITRALAKGQEHPREVPASSPSPSDASKGSPAERATARLLGLGQRQMSERPDGKNGEEPTRARVAYTYTGTEKEKKDEENEETHPAVRTPRERLSRRRAMSYPGEPFCLQPRILVIQRRRQRSLFSRTPVGCGHWSCPPCADMIRAAWDEGGREAWLAAQVAYVAILDIDAQVRWGQADGRSAYEALWARVQRRARRLGEHALLVDRGDGSAILLATCDLSRQVPGAQVVALHEREETLVTALRSARRPLDVEGVEQPVTNPVRGCAWRKFSIPRDGINEYVGPADARLSEPQAIEATQRVAEARGARSVVAPGKHGDLEIALYCDPQERLEVLAWAIGLHPTRQYLARHGLEEPVRWREVRREVSCGAGAQERD